MGWSEADVKRYTDVFNGGKQPTPAEVAAARAAAARNQIPVSDAERAAAMRAQDRAVADPASVEAAMRKNMPMLDDSRSGVPFSQAGYGAAEADEPLPPPPAVDKFGGVKQALTPSAVPAPSPSPRMLPPRQRPGGGSFTPEPADADPFMGMELDPDGAIFHDKPAGKKRQK